MLNISKVNDVIHARFVDEKRFNAVISQDVKEALNKHFETDKKLILDLDGITFIDSSGFGAMLSVLKAAKNAGAQFKLCNISADVLELIKLMQLHNIFDIQPNLASCLNSFSFKS